LVVSNVVPARTQFGLPSGWPEKLGIGARTCSPMKKLDPTKAPVESTGWP